MVIDTILVSNTLYCSGRDQLPRCARFFTETGSTDEASVLAFCELYLGVVGIARTPYTRKAGPVGRRRDLIALRCLLMNVGDVCRWPRVVFIEHWRLQLCVCCMLHSL